MSGETDIKKLLKNMSPVLNEEEYIFISMSGRYGDYSHLTPLCSFMESEGLTLIISKDTAVENNIEFEEVFKAITLEVHSSLDAVGLTAAVASKLAGEGISANVVAAYYHDHIFVQARSAEKALAALKALTS